MGIVQKLFIVAALLTGISTQVLAQQKSLPSKLEGHGGPVKAVQLNADGTYALTSSFDYSIIFWDLSGNAAQIKHRMLGHNAAVNDIAFIPDTDPNETNYGKAVSVSDDGSLGVWDLTTGTVVEMIKDGEEKMLDVVVSPDGRLAAAAKWDGTARVYDLSSQKEVMRFSGHKGPVNAVVFSDDSKSLLSASYDGDIRIWHLSENSSLSKYQHGSILHSNGWGINVLAMLPEKLQLVFGALNGTTGVYDLEADEVIELGMYEKPILSLAMSDEAGWFAAGSGDGFIRVYNTQTLDLIEQYRDAAGPIWGLAFSKNGKQVYKAGLDDFVSQWQVSPRNAIEPSQSELPRRFQVVDSVDPGENEFKRKCSVCHTLSADDKNRAGPTLYKLFGRKAGTVEGYAYSPALLNSDIIWNEETIGRLFDDGPDIVTPGTKMPIQRLKSVDRRNDLIAYLKRATTPTGE